MPPAERRVRDGVEVSFGGVAVRGGDVLVITPAGRRRVTALPKGGPLAGETDVLLTATQAELAQLAGSSRESASRFLAVLERAGVISQGRGRLTVHDPAALSGYVY